MQNDSSHRWWDWWTAAIMIVMVMVPAARLLATEWTPGLEIVQGATFLACALGMAFGYSRFRARTVAGMGIGYSLVLVPWQLLGQVGEESQVRQQLASLGARLAYAIQLLGKREPVTDPLFFVTCMVVLYWILFLLSGYLLVRRGSILGAIVPGAAGLIIIQYYDGYNPQRIWFLAVYFFFAMLLLGRLNLINNHTEWRERHVFTSTDAGFDITRGALVAATGLIFVAWLIPVWGATFDPAREFWQTITDPLDRTRDRLGDALASVHGTGGGVGDPFGGQLGLGRSAVTGDTEMFTVNAPGIAPVRYYWRGRVYDTFENNKWSNSAAAHESYDPDDDGIDIPFTNNREVQSFIFAIKSDRTSIVTAVEPVWISRAADMTFLYTDERQIDLLVLRASNALRAGDVYEVRAVLNNPTLKNMRATGSNYPEWVRKHYLQLPENFSKRIQDLAIDIAREQSNPYDKVTAINEYLRNEITYADTIQPAPPGIDPLEWFLFMEKEGFCNYYATTEVLMLRSIGIPARMAVGYAQGARESDGLFHIQVKATHAWPEVYFPGIGWVEFEPTSNQPNLVRPQGLTSIPDTNNGNTQRTDLEPDGGHETEEDQTTPDNTSTDSRPFQLNPTVGLWVIIILTGAGWGAFLVILSRKKPISARIPHLIKKVYERNNLAVPEWLKDWIRWTEKTPIERAFESINRTLKWFRNPAPVHATPFERAETLKRLLPDAAEWVDTLTAEHVAALYSPHPANLQRAQSAGNHIYFLALRRFFYPF